MRKVNGGFFFSGPWKKERGVTEKSGGEKGRDQKRERQSDSRLRIRHKTGTGGSGMWIAADSAEKNERTNFLVSRKKGVSIWKAGG